MYKLIDANIYIRVVLAQKGTGLSSGRKADSNPYYKQAE